ncbi:post-GPI attachment to proteins factor 3-like isoform X1 [Olea europaea var. sylvestris]|uniref:Post-GPI attachment to proteins factor 3 n=3 Tax=Olea europaea subsp. europaea TaxID=158383 RepID=A0A8S0SK27_OLEEU|nr:post-GPI attachment to proteins factor 3-like isoform X1 [Olea europaea var. sylvestris]CAA2993010.1 post-GPI attachment to s factor 3-like [Olea europaea subsp. europaea]
MNKMADRYWIIFFVVYSCLVRVLDASAGDADPLYRDCVGQCEKTGCVGERCFLHCKFSSDSSSLDGPWYMQEPLYLQWKQWDCQSDCRYHCMLDREKERAELGHGPFKYHGKWPFRRLYGFQEPVSVGLSALNLAMHFHGWLSFFILLYYKLPLKPDKRPCYDYTGLWHIYGFLSMNSWFWSAVFHSRDVDLTEKLDYSSAVALLGYSLLLAIVRSFSVRNEAARVMVAAPLVAFTTTHILYLNNYKMDYGWNMKVCVVMGVTQLLVWAMWAGVTRHPSRWKLWSVVVGGGLAMLLEIYDFPPYEGLVDAHALWHATTIPLTYVWWSFIKDDVEYRTSSLLKKVK